MISKIEYTIKNKRKFGLILLLLIVGLQVKSQELMCNVSVSHKEVAGTNNDIFDALSKDITEFMNNTAWTDNVFSNNEKIECKIQINISDFNNIDKFKGTLSVQSSRPIYNTNYKSILFNHKEKDNQFQFEYVEQQALYFNESSFTSNLTSVLAFYAYIIIGLDYDSFEIMGGEPYFKKAKEIVDNAQSAREPGWKAFEESDKTNRYYLAENLLNAKNGPVRRFLYRYHRLGLDLMTDKTEMARNEMAESLKLLQKTFRSDRESYILKIMMTTKLSEFVNVFSESPDLEKRKAYVILKEIDPSSQKIEDMIK